MVFWAICLTGLNLFLFLTLLVSWGAAFLRRRELRRKRAHFSKLLESGAFKVEGLK